MLWRVSGALRLLLVSVSFVALSATSGCSDGVAKRYPVEGQVLVDGEPLRGASGSVMFVPDRSKGNESPHSAAGTIDGEGRYRLQTKGAAGAPAGWYIAVVTAVPPGTGDRDVVYKPLHHQRFSAEKTSPLAVEVTASPPANAYDLKVTRK